MSYHDYNVFKKEMTNNYNNLYPSNYNSISDTTYADVAAPVGLVVGLLVGGSLLFCLLVMCCCCCKHTTRGRVLVPPPPLTPPTPPVPQVYIHQTYAGMPNAGPSLCPEMAPIAQPYKAGSATALVPVPDYPPSYDTDRLLHGDGDANTHPS
ncbi:unnamed protein product [Arctia plantaginis]|uniref:Uncharacterized protein n=1 Tax=Arctia plantaginis TaxID=874455 RepID=A0A8S1A700_ARCPL|nr:unnamed protein product [Arctia plantaginis]